jgi:hypothetical protein
MSTRAGAEGERIAEWILVRKGWKILDRQVRTDGGHILDCSALHPLGPECLVEIKVWGADPSGKDTVKKAIGTAYDLREVGEIRPYVLVMSHHLSGNLGGMIERAHRAGVIYEVHVLGSSEPYSDDAS